MYFKLSLLILTLTTFVNSENVICYFTSWTTYRNSLGKYTVANLPSDLCTHIHYGFVGLQEWDGKLWIMDDWEANGLFELEHLLDKRKENPDLKLIVSMGGWNEGSQKYSKVANDTQLRANMIESILDFLVKYDFDGFDLDWEYPDQRGGKDVDIENYIILLNEIKQALSPNYTLSIAVTGGVQSANISYDFQKIGDAVDYINVMAYDYHGAFEPYVGHYAPFNASHLDLDNEVNKDLNVVSGLEFWLSKGVDPKKLNLGIGTYGRCFTLDDPSNTTLYAPARRPCNAGIYTQSAGTLGYNEICKYYQDYQYFWDDEQQVPHLVKGDQWIGFDNIKSVQIKSKYAKSLGFSGFMVWSLDTDDFLGYCNHGQYPLINAMKDAWNSD